MTPLEKETHTVEELAARAVFLRKSAARRHCQQQDNTRAVSKHHNGVQPKMRVW